MNGLVYGYPITRKTIYGTEAQVVEQSAHNRLVEGSSPSRSTTHTGRVRCDNPATRWSHTRVIPDAFTFWSLHTKGIKHSAKEILLGK